MIFCITFWFATRFLVTVSGKTSIWIYCKNKTKHNNNSQGQSSGTLHCTVHYVQWWPQSIQTLQELLQQITLVKLALHCVGRQHLGYLIIFKMRSFPFSYHQLKFIFFKKITCLSQCMLLISNPRIYLCLSHENVYISFKILVQSLSPFFSLSKKTNQNKRLLYNNFYNIF